jgi:CubicO group peptidase (beta-lactamase class C family)
MAAARYVPGAILPFCKARLSHDVVTAGTRPCRWPTLSAALLLAACSGGGANNEIPVTGVEVPAFRAVDTKVSEILRKLDIPGVGLTVARNGRILYQRGFGWADRATGQEVQPQTLFRIASVSKATTAVGVLRAFESELPDVLDRPVFGEGGLLSGARCAQVKDSRVLKVTLRDLLQHRGGWDSNDYDPKFELATIARVMNVPAPVGAADIIEYMLKHHGLQFEPGTRYSYRNFGYNVLGRVLEERTGLPYAEAMRRLVFVPAGVTTAAIGGDQLAQRLPGETIYYDDPRWPDVPSQTGIGCGPASYNDFHLQAMDSHAAG